MNPLRTFLILTLLAACIASCGGSDSPDIIYTDLHNPEKITILGYASDAMEPFISRDGNYLFFNNNVTGAPEKDIFCASRITDTIFQFRGAVTAVNSAAVDGVPTLADSNRFYYLSIVNYAAPGYYTLYTGTWTGSTVTGNTPITGLTISTNLIFYFDIDVSPDGATAYLARGDYTTGSLTASDLVVAAGSGSAFSVRADSGTIMDAVNTGGLEYAPAISKDGKELFFTRFDSLFATPRIYRAVRNGTDDAFEYPQLVVDIEGFVEGPAFSPDEKSIYYHRLNTTTALFEIYRVTRM